MASPEDVFLWVAAAALLAGGIACMLFVHERRPGHLVAAQRLLGAAVLVMGGALAYLGVRFLTGGIHLAYVHAHARLDAPWPYRLAGVWGGREGTLLLWAFFAAAALYVTVRGWQAKAQRGQAPLVDPGHPLPWTTAIGSFTTLALVLLLLQHDPFRRTEAWRLAVEPAGRGLQPVLETPFMVLHPPLQFLAYGLAVLLFAASVAYLVTGRREWADVALPWARATLFVSWTGLGIGALWAYYVLNFGGYWAWDPVETANLLAFLPLVPLVHGLIYYRKRGMFAAMAPLFGILAFLATVFSSLATRTGLWVSVHAFTDPAQTFEPDPLARLLDIVAADAALRTLLRIFLGAALVAVGAYVYALSRTGPAGGRSGRVVVACGGFFVGAGLALTLVDPGLALGALFEAASWVPGPTAAGLGLLSVALVAFFAWPALGSGEEDAPRRAGREDWISMANLVYVGMLLVVAGLLIVFLIDVTTVNGYDRALYDARAPWFAVPFLLVLGVALGNRFLGTRRSLTWAGASLAAGLVLAVWRPTLWPVMLGAPVALFALHGSLLKLFKVSDEASAPMRLRVAGGILLVGGAAALVYWSNPPSRIPFGFTTLRPHAAWAAVGYPLGLLSLAGGASALRAAHWRLALAGAAGLAASLAWVVGLPLGLVALAALVKERDRFRAGVASWSLAPAWKRLERPFRKTGVYLVHVALVVGMSGYAASVYLEGPEEALRLESGGAAASAHGYEFRLVDASTQGESVAQEVHAWVEIARDGASLGRVPLTMWLELPAHYAERVTVERYAWEDVYLRPFRFVVSSPEGGVAFVAHEDGVRVPAGSSVDVVEFTVKTLPGMHLVWGGVWMLSVGAGVALAVGGYRFEPSRPQREPV